MDISLIEERYTAINKACNERLERKKERKKERKNSTLTKVPNKFPMYSCHKTYIYYMYLVPFRVRHKKLSAQYPE